MSKQVFRFIAYKIFRFKIHPYVLVGNLIGGVVIKFVSQKYIKKIKSDFLAGKAQTGFLATVIKTEINSKYYKLGDIKMREINRAEFWGSEAGMNWHEGERELYKDIEQFAEDVRFKKYRAPLVNKIIEYAELVKIDTICEIGTGNGLFLVYLSNCLKEKVNKFTGIDLCLDQIQKNNSLFKNNREVQFEHIQIMDWISNKKNSHDTSIMFVSCGTFEYFTESEIRELLEFSKPLNVAFSLCEPINIDLDNEFVSKPRREIAFSHNYKHIFETCGFEVMYHNLVSINPNDKNYNNVIMMGRPSN